MARTSAWTDSRAREGARMAVSTAPSTAAAMALPMLRKNCTEAVAIPRSDQGTEDWTAISMEVVLRPKPAPLTKLETSSTVLRKMELSEINGMPTNSKREQPAKSVIMPAIATTRKL